MKVYTSKHQHRATAAVLRPVDVIGFRLTGSRRADDRRNVWIQRIIVHATLSLPSYTLCRTHPETCVDGLLRFLALSFLRGKRVLRVERARRNGYFEWAGIKRASVQLSATRHPNPWLPGRSTPLLLHPTCYPRVPYASPDIRSRSGQQTPDFPERSISSQPAPYNGRCHRCRDIYALSFDHSPSSLLASTG